MNQTIQTMTAREMALTSHNLGRTGETATTADGSVWFWVEYKKVWERQTEAFRRAMRVAYLTK